MSKNPNELYEKLLTAIKAWSLVRPNKSYAGFTLESFKAAVDPSLKVREQIAQTDAQKETLIDARSDADVQSAKALRRVIHSVIADPEDGEDGELYAQMGYMPRSARNVLQSVSRTKSAEKAPAQTPEPEKEEEVVS